MYGFVRGMLLNQSIVVLKNKGPVNISFEKRIVFLNVSMM